MDWKPARIEWVTHDQGGRKQPPSGYEPPVYWAVVKLLVVEPQANSWSIYIRKRSSSNDGFAWNAAVKFRVGESPHHLLNEGVHFELYEGGKRVVNGVIGCIALETAGQQT